MFTRALATLAATAALAACQPAVPDSGRGVGFDGSFEAQQRERDAALAASTVGAVPAPASVSQAPLGEVNDGSPEATAAETARILAATRPGGVGNSAATNSGIDPVQASPSNPPPPVLGAGGISNENSFDAVAEERTIAGDAARLAANRAQYQVVQPEALPSRVETGPNVVAYALQSNHAVGTKLYTRIGFNKASRAERACAQYNDPNEAQVAFLAAGGPDKDRNGLDPDGDGYACGWSPEPFRRAARG
jgi:hypothetical protein